MLKKVAFATIMLALAGCASPAERQRDMRARQAESFLQRLPSIADPGKVAATDIAMARAASDDGQWTAMRENAAPGAAMLLASGAQDAGSYLSSRPDPLQAVQWAPTQVWSSCDGMLAVSFGVTQDPGGVIGTYLRVWQWRRGGSYRWTYSVATPDVPQPPPPPPELEPDENTIVVAALDAIQARTADCPAGDGARRRPVADAPPQGERERRRNRPEPEPEETGNVLTQSPDGTLAWRVAQLGEERWQVVVDWQRDGSWQEAVRFDLPDRLEAR